MPISMSTSGRNAQWGTAPVAPSRKRLRSDGASRPIGFAVKPRADGFKKSDKRKKTPFHINEALIISRNPPENLLNNVNDRRNPGLDNPQYGQKGSSILISRRHSDRAWNFSQPS